MKFLSLMLLVFSLSLNAEVLIQDNFTKDKMPTRKPARGDWKISEGVISCDFSDELYKKYKNHGPIVWYNFKTSTDCTIEMEYMISGGTSSVVFSVNDAKGHVYRTTVMKDGKRKGAWSKGWLATKKSSPAGKIDYELVENKWVPVKITFKGNKMTFSIDGNSQEFEHDGFAREKTRFNYQFVKGNLKVRNLKISKE